MDRSESVNELAKALSQAQSQIEAADKNAKNPYFNSTYANLKAVWSVIRDPLTSNGLSIVQLPDIDEQGNVIIETVLMHSSGQWISSKLKMIPVDKKPQTIGICISYARRYALAAMVGVYQEDDDGNAASGVSQTPQKQNTASPQAPKQKQVPKPMSKEEAASKAKNELFKKAVAVHGWTQAQVVEYMTKTMPGKSSLKDLDDAEFKDLMEFVAAYTYQYSISTLGSSGEFEAFGG